MNVAACNIPLLPAFIILVGTSSSVGNSILVEYPQNAKTILSQAMIWYMKLVGVILLTFWLDFPPQPILGHHLAHGLLSVIIGTAPLVKILQPTFTQLARRWAMQHIGICTLFVSALLSHFYFLFYPACTSSKLCEFIICYKGLTESGILLSCNIYDGLVNFIM